MNILINASNLSKGGGVQVGDSFIRELMNHPEHQYMVVCSKQVAESLGDLSVFPDFMHIKIAPPSGIKGILLRLLHRNPFLSRLSKEFSIDAVFSVFGPPYWRPNVLHLCGFAKAQFIYLDSPFFSTIGVAGRLRAFLKRSIQMSSFLHDVDVYVTENEEISVALRKKVSGKHVYTVSNCCNPVFDTPDHWRNYPLPFFEGTTLLTVSADYPHKNLRIIPRIAEYLQKKDPAFKFRFVVTLQAESFGYTKDNVPEWLLPIGKVDISECPSLYEQSDFMFLPTFLEVFSASYVEAMKMQRPILTSDTSFAHGLCGDAAMYFDPMSPSEAGDAIYRLANDPERQRFLVDFGKRQIGKFLDSQERTRRYLHLLEKEFQHLDTNDGHSTSS